MGEKYFLPILIYLSWSSPPVRQNVTSAVAESVEGMSDSKLLKDVRRQSNSKPLKDVRRQTQKEFTRKRSTNAVACAAQRLYFMG
jgi:hypothetical protein